MKLINIDKKGFTLIELLAVIVILAIIALVAVPIVINIISSSKASTKQRSIDLYGKSVELAVARYRLNNNELPTDISQIEVQYNGNEVICENIQIKSDGSVYLSNCTVDGESINYIYGTQE